MTTIKSMKLKYPTVKLLLTTDYLLLTAIKRLCYAFFMSFGFGKFEIYKLAKKLHLTITEITTEFSKSNYYIVDRVRRSSLSIVLNIAEGSSKQSDKDFNRFISIALGSLDETVACLEICVELRMVTDMKFKELEAEYEILSKQLGGFSKSLKLAESVVRSKKS